MPAALDVDREQVRMLVLAVGVREAARQMELAEGTVLYWSMQGNWLADTRIRPALLPRPASQVPRSIASIKPADALEKLLLERKERTKLAQSDYLAKASEKLAEVSDDELLDHAPVGKTLAEMASKVYPETTVDQSTHLSFFSVAMERPGNGEAQAIDLSDQAIDPLEEY